LGPPGYWAGALSPFNAGASIQLTFANGTVIPSPQMATTSKNFTGVVDGKSFFRKFCTGASAMHAITKKREASASPTESPFAPVWTSTKQKGPAHYPKPLVTAPSNAISGFVNLKQPELAVLAVPTFETEHWVEFQNAIRELLATAKDLGKTRLIIDLRGNTGGRVPLGLDFFSQLFPKMYAYNGNNFRAHDLFNRMGKIITEHFAGIDAEEAQRSGASRNASIYTNLNAAVGLNQAGKNFASWEDFYGPNQAHGGSFTNIERWNLSDSAQMTGPFDWNVSNHGGDLVNINKGITVFDPKNILLIHDGFCGSTCADFAELMKAQAGVRSIAFGGRKQTGPMQGVGNVKGASVWPMNFIGTLIAEAFSFATPDVANQLDATYGRSLAALEHTLSRAGIKGTSDVQAKVNTRNNIRRNDTSLTPLHFVYEAADCRLFYTAASLSDQSVVWSAAYDAMWGSAACVDGSRDHPSAKIVNGAALQAKFPEGADNTFGARYPPVPQPETTNTAGNNGEKANAASRGTVLSPITVAIAAAIGLAPLVCQMW
jgi:hypothetical protein